MSNPDSFIAEVTEEVRRDRLYQTFRRYGWIAIALVLLLVGGAAWIEYTKARVIARAEAQGDAILTALEAPDEAARVAAMSAITVDGPAAGMTALLTAAEQQRLGDVSAAVLTLDQLTADTAVDPLYRDLARLKSLMLQVGTADPAMLRSELALLAEPGATYRLLAQEQLALVDLADGDTAAALVTLAAIAADAEVTAGLRDRVNGLIVALGGDLEAAPVPAE